MHACDPMLCGLWHLFRYSTEAVLPAMTAVSGWWTADHTTANASMVVSWPLCIMLEKSRCLARTATSAPFFDDVSCILSHVLLHP